MNPSDYVFESCAIQNATSIEDILGMYVAYDYCRHFERTTWGQPIVKKLTDDVICQIASYVNHTSDIKYRRHPVIFSDGIGKAAHHEEIPRLISQLISIFDEEIITAEEFYQEFETIHPFHDGNGRVGSLLYNLIRPDSFGSALADPIHPPEYKKGY